MEVSCCNEYGFCRTREAWAAAKFRDCNGVSNGIALPDAVLQLENALGGQAGAGLGAETQFDPDYVSRSGKAEQLPGPGIIFCGLNFRRVLLNRTG